MELARFYLLQSWTGRRLADPHMRACLDVIFDKKDRITVNCVWWFSKYNVQYQ